LPPLACRVPSPDRAIQREERKQQPREELRSSKPPTMGFWVTTLIFLLAGVAASLLTLLCCNRGPSTNLYAPASPSLSLFLRFDPAGQAVIRRIALVFLVAGTGNWDLGPRAC
ncbi:hypothetical protein BAE44_0003978, partial [Dichanthelium oligosanthes]